MTSRNIQPVIKRFNKILDFSNNFEHVNINKFSEIKNDEVTLYIKGFSNHSILGTFDEWRKSHNKLEKKYDWNRNAYGYYWHSGDVSIIPYFTTSKIAYDLYKYGKIVGYKNPMTMIPSLLIDLSLTTYSMYHVYNAIRSRFDKYVEDLKKILLIMKDNNKYVRIVCYSLGCKLVSETLKEMDIEEYPNEIHMCSPAVIESNNEQIFNIIEENDSKNSKIICYYSPRDIFLRLTYDLLNKHDYPIGVKGLDNNYKNIKAIDVTKYLDLNIHSSYKNNFYYFAEDLRKGNK